MRSRYFVDPAVHSDGFAVFREDNDGGVYLIADGLSETHAELAAWRMNLGPL